MKNLLIKGVVLLGTAGVLAAAGAGAASASTTSPVLPHTYPLVSVTHLYDRPDSGGNGDWAKDGMTRVVTYQFTGMTGALYDYDAQLRDFGSFDTILGAFTPNQGAPYTGDVIDGQVYGFLRGSADFSFTSSTPIDSSVRNLGVPGTEFGAPGNPAQTTSLWYEQAFTSPTVFGGTGIGNWGWHYVASVPEHKYVRVLVTKNGKPVYRHGHRQYRTVGVTYFLHERWADTSAVSNGDGQLPVAGNILGR